jgi:magnesium chelatase family protein
VNLAPADLKNEGSGFDLPIAVGILAALNLLLSDKLKDYIFVGELSLDGRVKSVKVYVVRRNGNFEVEN